MSLAIAFWIAMFIWLIFGAITVWPQQGQPFNRSLAGGTLLLFILFVILGWKNFGPPIHG